MRSMMSGSIHIGRQVGHDQGFQEGFEAGKLVGFIAGLESLKGALSDGTRKGSSECARALESRKRMGINLEDEE